MAILATQIRAWACCNVLGGSIHAPHVHAFVCKLRIQPKPWGLHLLGALLAVLGQLLLELREEAVHRHVLASESKGCGLAALGYDIQFLHAPFISAPKLHGLPIRMAPWMLLPARIDSRGHPKTKDLERRNPADLPELWRLTSDILRALTSWRRSQDNTAEPRGLKGCQRVSRGCA